MFFFLAMLYIFIFFSIGSIKLPNGAKACISINNYYAKHIKDWVLFGTRIVPVVVIVVCNGLIISTLIRASAKRKQLAAGGGAGSDSNRSVVLMLISISIAFIVLVVPVVIQWLRTNNFQGSYSSTSHQAATERMVWAITVMMTYVNHAINFLMYLISGSEFRKELLGWLKGVFGCGVNDQKVVESSTRESSLASISAATP
jgi:hypothetical protein